MIFTLVLPEAILECNVQKIFLSALWPPPFRRKTVFRNPLGISFSMKTWQTKKEKIEREVDLQWRWEKTFIKCFFFFFFLLFFDCLTKVCLRGRCLAECWGLAGWAVPAWTCGLCRERHDNRWTRYPGEQRGGGGGAMVYRGGKRGWRKKERNNSRGRVREEGEGGGERERERERERDKVQ